MFNFKSILPLTIASIKMYFRDFTAIFFTFVFPVIFLLVFGFINNNDSLTLNIAYYNDKTTMPAQVFDESFSELVIQEDNDDPSRIFKIKEDVGTIEEAKVLVSDGDINAAIVIPQELDEKKGGDVQIYLDESDQAFNGVIINTINSILAEFNKQANIAISGQAPLEPFGVQAESVQTDDFDAIDYLVPGIIAFSILSLGVFSITEGFIQLKTNGSLRRLQVAPIQAGSFLVAQSITRLIMTVINVLTMLLLSMMLFDFTMHGDIFSFLVVAVFGIILFLGFGYAIAGWAKDGNQAAPISNIIFFPMMFLSGTFFPRETFPDWLVPITDYMPLTYVADAMRKISADGETLIGVAPEMLGIIVWTALIYAIAVKLFRWE